MNTDTPTDKQKIIFVDIDGPLLPGKMHLFHENRKTGKKDHPMFDQFAIRAFNLWAKYSNAKIVFSTNWAMSFTDDELKAIMAANGLEFNYHENVITPKRFSSNRYQEIMEWVSDNEDCIFIAVDDDTSCRYIEEFFEDPPKHYTKNSHGVWIDVNYSNGLSLDNFKDGCQALGIDWEDLMEQEFGIKKLTDEEKAQREKDLDLLIGSII